MKFKYKFYMVPGGGYGSLKNGRFIIITFFKFTINLALYVNARGHNEVIFYISDINIAVIIPFVRFVDQH